MNDFNEYVRESFSLAGDIVIRSMMGGYYDGSKTLMHVFDRFEDTDLIAELLNGMHAELPEKKPKKTK